MFRYGGRRRLWDGYKTLYKGVWGGTKVVYCFKHTQTDRYSNRATAISTSSSSALVLVCRGKLLYAPLGPCYTSVHNTQSDAQTLWPTDIGTST